MPYTVVPSRPEGIPRERNFMTPEVWIYFTTNDDEGEIHGEISYDLGLTGPFGPIWAATLRRPNGHDADSPGRIGTTMGDASAWLEANYGQVQ